MNMKRLVLMLGFLVTGIVGYSQSDIGFTYDDSGNRTKRELINLNKSASISGLSGKEWDDPLLDKLSTLEIKIYPNPTKGKIKIEIPQINNSLKGTIEVFDTNGRLVLNKTDINPSNVIDIHQVKNGFYFLKIHYLEETLQWKIIKQ